MDSQDWSHRLFGRHEALLTFVVIARLPDPRFSTKDLTSRKGISGPSCSKELTRLVDLRLVSRVGRRGEFRRNDDTDFWRLVESLGTHANIELPEQ